MPSNAPNNRFDFDDELMQGYSSVDQGTLQNNDDLENSPLNIYDHDNPDISYMEKEADALIIQSGAPTYIYLRTNDMGQVDDTYDENPNPIFDSAVKVKGLFTPEVVSLVRVKWGIDAQAKFKISYSRARLLSEIGPRLIRSGDVIKVPYNTLVQTQQTEFLEGKDNRLDQFRVISASDYGSFNYRNLYWVCIVEPLSGDIVVRPK